MQSVNSKMTGQYKRWIMPLIFGLSLLAGSLAAEDELAKESGVLRSRVYKLKHITSQQAKEMFLKLSIGKNYNTLSSDVLILTTNVGSDLVKATELIAVLDQSPAPKIEILKTGTESLQKPDAFIAALKDVTVGTMMEIPPKGSEKPVIIDVAGSKLIAIASEDVLSSVKSTYLKWEQDNQTTAPADMTADKTASQPSTQVSQKSSEPVQPEVLEPIAAAEPNLPQIAPEPNELAKPVETPADSAESLEAIANRLVEMSLAADANSPAEEQVTKPAETIPEPNKPAPTEASRQNAETFLDEGLLQELADAEQQTQTEQAPTEAVVAEVPETEKPQPVVTETDNAVAQEPTPEKTELDEGMKMIQDLLAQAKADEEQALAAEKAAAESDVQESENAVQPEQTLPAKEVSKIQVAEPVEEAEPAEDTEPTEATTLVQTEPEFGSLSEEELDTVVDLPQEVELESLVDLVGKQLGLNYFYDPTILKNQKITLKINGGKIKVREMYKLLESVLRQKGFVMARRDQLVTILKAADANQVEKGADIPIRQPDDPIPAGMLIVKTNFPLQNISPATAKTMLTQMQLGLSNGFTEIAETNSLIVMDYAYRMDQIKQVLEMIDVAGEKKEYKFRTLEYIKPSEIVPKLQSLVEQLADVSLQISSPAAAPAAPTTRSVTTRDPRTGKMVTRDVPVSTKTPSAPKPAAATPDTVFMDTDDRTNRILMIGRSEQVALVNELIDALDVPQYDLKLVREYIIQNVEATEVVDVLNELGLASVSVGGTSSTRTTSSRTTPSRTPSRTPVPNQPTAAQASSTAAQGGDQPNISIRPSSNSLLVNATAEQHKAIELVVAHVDVVQKDQRTIKQYEIQYVDTQEIMDTLTDLGIIAPQTTSTYGSGSYDRSRSTDPRSRSTAARTTAPGQPEMAEAAAVMSLPTAEGGSEKEITADQPQISILEATNSLLVYATPKQHDAIALVIAHADRQLDGTTTPYVVYALENQNPVELETVLTKLIQETVKEAEKTSSPESKIQTLPGTPGQSGGASSLLEEQKIKIIPDEKSYSLIVYANKRNQQWISDLIIQLDEYRPQVLLDLTLVEVSKLDQFQYDLDIIAAIQFLIILSGL